MGAAIFSTCSTTCKTSCALAKPQPSIRHVCAEGGLLPVQPSHCQQPPTGTVPQLPENLPWLFQFFTIKSGPDMIWQSSDCDRAGLPSQTVTLQPNTPVTSSPSEWLRVRSSSKGCGAGQLIVDAGAYNLTATVNGVLSQPNQFLLK